MNASDAIRRGVANEGGFFSPYYLFDLMARQHRDELDFEGRESARRRLPRFWRRALARLDGDASIGAVWREWLKELFASLGLELLNNAEPVGTTRHGAAPISHSVLAPGGRALLLLVDIHPFGVDLDRVRYPRAKDDQHTTREPVSRAFELALDYQSGRDVGYARFGLLTNGRELRLYRRGGTVSRQFLRVDFAGLIEEDRDDEWTAFWGLLRYAAFVPSENDNLCLLDRVLDESQRHASRIADDLRKNVVSALESLINGIIHEKANARLWDGGRPDAAILARLFEETLYLLYRLLFVLYAESRDILPVGSSSAYRDTYSVEHLRDLAEKDARHEDAEHTYYIDSLRLLFRLIRKGVRCGEFEIAPIGGHGPEDSNWETIRTSDDPHLTSLFDARRTQLLDACRIPDAAMRKVVRELSLSRAKRKRDTRERFSYADLGVDQLGSIYEGLLVYEPSITEEETVVVKIAGEERLVTRAEAEMNDLPVVEDTSHPPGTFLLRLWGGRRKGSGSYYTPAEITAFLVKEALEARIEPMVARAADAWASEQALAKAEPRIPVPQSRIAEEILDIRVCDPAMGSGAFLVQACRYLADAYGRVLVAEGRDVSGRIEQQELLRHKRNIAERCLYGVDLNPLAVELAKVSIWLETLSRGRPLSFLDAHLRCGNSLLGAQLRDSAGAFDAERLSTIPSDALKLVEEEPTPKQKADERNLVDDNKQALQRIEAAVTSGQEGFPEWGRGGQRVREVLDGYLESRAGIARSDEDRSDSEAQNERDEKEAKFREAYSVPGSPAHRLREVCDLWCAAWFRAEEEDAPAFDSDEYRAVAAKLLSGRGIADPPKWLEFAQRSAREQRFFHWELEFPEVFLRSNGGFDAVVGNPPWEKISGSSSEMAGEFDPMLKTLRGKERDDRLAEILADPDIGPGLVTRARARAQYARYAREGPMFKGIIRGELNTFAPFTLLSWRLHRVGGAMALVVKDAFHLGAERVGGPLRAAILEHGIVRVLATSDNEKKIFDAHHLLRFDLLVAARGAQPGPVPISVHRFRTAREVVQNARDGATVPLDFLRSTHGRLTKPIPEILDDQWPALWEKAHQSANGSTRVEWSAELHTSADKDCWTRDSKPHDSPGPVLAMVGPFDALSYRPLAWLKSDAAAMELIQRKAALGAWRVAVRLRANQKDERAIIAALIPPTAATCHYLQTTTSPSTPAEVAHVCALANSLVLDYLVRPFVGSNMLSGILNRLPWNLRTPDSLLVEASSRLTATRLEFELLFPLCNGNPPVESIADRARVRATIDARVAHLYGLSAPEFARVLAWFRLLDQDQPPLPGEAKSFVTRDTALLKFFDLLGLAPPTDVVLFLSAAGKDIAPITGPIRDLRARVDEATKLGAVAYVPSRTGTGASTDSEREEVAEEEEAVADA